MPLLHRIALLLSLSTAVFGQRVLYNKGLDENGRAVSAAAARLMSRSVTDNELANLAILEKVQIDRVLGAAEVTMRREVEGLTTWGSVIRLAGGIQTNIDLVNFDSGSPAEIQERLAAIEREKDRLRRVLMDLKSAAKQNPPSLDAVIGFVGDVQDFSTFAGEAANIKEARQASASLQELTNGLKELNALITTVSTIWTSARAVREDPESLAPSRQETELALLAVEAQYLKELTLLRARKQLDVAEVEDLLGQLQSKVQNYPRDKQIRQDFVDIASGLTAGNYDTQRLLMDEHFRVLFLAASAAAQNVIAADLESTRETLAYRRYQIRTQAIYNGSYEIAIKAASNRLETYYGAGLKPAQVAQLLHDLAALVSLPAIAF